MEIEIIKDYRTLKKGDKFVFDGMLNTITGVNGSGKSSLLNLIRSHWDGHYMGRVMNPKDYCSIKGLLKYPWKLDFNTETDGYNGKSFSDMDYLLSSGGIQAIHTSTGQTQLVAISNIKSKILDNVAKHPSQRGLIILDEIERGLDLKTQAMISIFIRQISNVADIIIATHSLLLMKNLKARVYVMENRKWSAFSTYFRSLEVK